MIIDNYNKRPVSEKRRINSLEKEEKEMRREYFKISLNELNCYLENFTFAQENLIRHMETNLKKERCY